MGRLFLLLGNSSLATFYSHTIRAEEIIKLHSRMAYVRKSHVPMVF